MILLLITFATSFFAATALTPLIIKFYRRRGWDKAHHGRRQSVKDTHSGLIPRGGGLAIFLSLALVIGVWALFEPGTVLTNWIGQSIWPANVNPQILAVFAGALILAFSGLLDDIFDLSPWLRLGLNILAAWLLVTAGLTINFVTNPLGDGVLDFSSIAWLPPLITVIYVVALTNITNWAKGIDGQMPGIMVIATLIIGGVAWQLVADLNFVTWLAVLTAGSFAGFLIWNFYPQKIMPGYGGGALAGFFLAVLSMMAGAKIATLFMVLSLPIADATFTIARRLIAGKSIFLGDRGHLHHKLLDQLGWGRQRIAIFYWLTTLIMGGLALVLPTWGKIGAFLLVSGFVFSFLIIVKIKSLRRAGKC